MTCVCCYRDATLDLEIGGRSVTSDDYLEDCLVGNADESDADNSPGLSIKRWVIVESIKFTMI